MAYTPNNDFILEVQKGNVAGHSGVGKFGRNTDIDNANNEDIWDGGGIWVAPTTARTHDIASDSTSDASGGVGARTVRVYGLTDWDTAEISEAVTMNGTSNVATSNAYVIIHRMRVMTWGATSVNVGKITATAQTDGTVTARISDSPINFGQTQMAIYGVPSTQTAYVLSAYSDVLRNSGTTKVDNHLLVNPRPDAVLDHFITKDTFVSLNTVGHTQSPYPAYKTFAGPCIIKMQADVSANNTDVSAGFNLILADN